LRLARNQQRPRGTRPAASTHKLGSANCPRRSRACCGSPRSRPRRLARGCRRNSRSASGVALICPTWRTAPASQTATWANSRWTSSPMHLLMPFSLRLSMWERRRANDTYGFALAAHPGKSQGRPSTNTGSKPIERERPARPAFAPGCPVPDGRTVLTGLDEVSAISRGDRRPERRGLASAA
jgi:hypothetical protein